MVNYSSTRDHKRIWNREVYYPWVLEEIQSARWATQGGQGRVPTERAMGPEAHASFRTLGGSALGSLAKARSVNPNQKSGALVSRTVALSKYKGKPWKVGDYWSQGPPGQSYQELTRVCDSAGRYLGPASVWVAWCQLRDLQAAWPVKMDAKAANHGVVYLNNPKQKKMWFEMVVSVKWSDHKWIKFMWSWKIQLGSYTSLRSGSKEGRKILEKPISTCISPKVMWYHLKPCSLTVASNNSSIITSLVIN